MRFLSCVVLVAAVAFLGCAGPAEEAPAPVVEEPAEAPVVEMEDPETVELDEEQAAQLLAIAGGEAVGEAVVTAEPAEGCEECTRSISRIYSLAALDESTQMADGMATVSCSLTCSGSDCAMVGCEPSPSFGNCSQFNCGLSCTGSCTQTITTSSELASTLTPGG